MKTHWVNPKSMKGNQPVCGHAGLASKTKNIDNVDCRKCKGIYDSSPVEDEIRLERLENGRYRDYIKRRDTGA